MARTRYVHRTIVGTEAEVMTVNTSTKEVGSQLVSVQGSYEDTKNKSLVKAVTKGFEALNLKDTEMVTITAVHPVTKEYRMLESLFMSLAESRAVDGDEKGEWETGDEDEDAEDEDAEDEDAE